MMAAFDLNLSTQPFPAYRLINIALALVLAVLAVVSIWQAVGFVRYSEMARSIRSEEQENRVEAEALGRSVAELEARINTPESAAKLNEIGYLNHLILRKDLSWTKLIGILEEMVPENVHLTNLTPSVGANGTVSLSLGVRSRSIADLTGFIKRVEQSPLFEHLDIKVEEKTNPTVSPDVDMRLTADYHPERDVR